MLVSSIVGFSCTTQKAGYKVSENIQKSNVRTQNQASKQNKTQIAHKSSKPKFDKLA